MKNQKGITLIALVITIVILIILAGVAINLSIGDNGIFKRAKQARDMYTNSQIAEETKINEVSKQLETGDYGNRRRWNKSKRNDNTLWKRSKLYCRRFSITKCIR